MFKRRLYEATVLLVFQLKYACEYDIVKVFISSCNVHKSLKSNNTITASSRFLCLSQVVSDSHSSAITPMGT